MCPRRAFHRFDSFLTVILNAERRMTDRRSGEKSLCELEFNHLNIHLYLTLNYGTASEHSDFDFMVLYNVFVLSWGLTITQNSICTISDLDRSRLTDTPIRRKWPYRSRYRYGVSDRCIPNVYIKFCVKYPFYVRKGVFTIQILSIHTCQVKWFALHCGMWYLM